MGHNTVILIGGDPDPKFLMRATTQSGVFASIAVRLWNNLPSAAREAAKSAYF